MKADEQSGGPILLTVEGGVGTLTLNRPAALNAFNLEMATEILGGLAEFEANDNVKAIVLRGKGKVFSSGGDIKEMLQDVEQGKDRAAFFKAPLAAFGRIVLALRAIPKPVLAAVHGAVAGVAFNIMLACDLRVATDRTRFTQAFIRIGLSPDGGGTWLLPRVVGIGRACELMMLPSDVGATTALDWGLINWVVSADVFDETVKDIATQLANGPTQAMARTKELVNRSFESLLRDQIETERLAQVENADFPDFAEGLRAFVEKRLPRFATGET